MADVMGFHGFLQAARDVNLGVVLAGGLIGGLLQPIVARLRPDAVNPSSASYWQSPLLGAAAAGISVYVLAHTNTSDTVPTLFFSLLCGLAFPAVLVQAIGNVSRDSDLESNLGEIAEAAKSDSIPDSAAAAQQLRTALANNPLASVMPDAQHVIETTAQLAVANIANTAAPTAADQQTIVSELQDVGAVAKSAGWQQTAQAVADQLRKMSGSIDDETARAAAEQASSRLSDGGGA